MRIIIIRIYIKNFIRGRIIIDIFWFSFKMHYFVIHINKCDIYIWRYNKRGEIKTKYSCKSCTKLLYKYNLESRIFTFMNGKRINAILKNPEESLGNSNR